jgi:hypothetical protein
MSLATVLIDKRKETNETGSAEGARLFPGMGPTTRIFFLWDNSFEKTN